MRTHPPHLAGYTPEVHYDCPNCGELVHIVYRQTSATVDKENPYGFQGIWRETRFPGGTIVDSVGHQPTSYPYGNVCGYQLPPEATNDPVHFVDTMYQGMLPYWQRQKAKHIVAIDADKFLAGPWCKPAPAREADAQPIILVVQSYALAFVIKHKRLPNVRTESYNFGTDEQVKLADKFLAAIGAVLDGD